MVTRQAKVRLRSCVRASGTRTLQRVPDNELALRALSGAEVAVVADDFPMEEDVFHFGALTDVVDDEVAAGLRGFLVDEDADVRDIAAEIPGDQIAGRIVGGIAGDFEGLA